MLRQGGEKALLWSAFFCDYGRPSVVPDRRNFVLLGFARCHLFVHRRLLLSSAQSEASRNRCTRRSLKAAAADIQIHCISPKLGLWVVRASIMVLRLFAATRGIARIRTDVAFRSESITNESTGEFGIHLHRARARTSLDMLLCGKRWAHGLRPQASSVDICLSGAQSGRSTTCDKRSLREFND